MPGVDTIRTNVKAYKYEGTISPYRACKKGSVNGAVVAIAAATDEVEGFTIEPGTTGEQHGIAMDGGQILVEAGAAITAKAKLTIDAVGRVVTAAPGAGTNVQVFGKALEDAAAAGDLIPMQYTRYVMQG
jgi:hypothetical protein